MLAMDHPDDDRAADSDWLGLTVAPEGQMTERGWAVLRSLRMRLSELSPVRLVPSETWSVAFPGELVLVLPLHGGNHVSFQILVGQNDVTGEWQDAHYAWDVESDGVFVVPWSGDDQAVLERVLQLTEEELRRPIHRVRRRVRHVDGRPGWGTKGLRRKGTPMGYFDPI
jgi:hypothetical protein